MNLEMWAYICSIAAVVFGGVFTLWKLSIGVNSTLKGLDSSVQRLNEHLDEVKLDQKEIRDEQKKTNEKVFEHTVELEKQNGRLNAIEKKLGKA